MPGPEMLEDVCADVMEAAWTDRGRALILRNEDFYETYALDGAALVERACRLAGRDLTPDEWQQFIPEWLYERTCAGAAEEPPPAASSAPAVAGPPAAADGDKSEKILEVQRVAGVRLPECAGRAVPATCWYVSLRFLDEAVITRMSAGEPVAYYRVVRTGQWVVRDQAKAGPAVIPPAWAR
uniref:hypothetical protein n=1 Tax=Paractinoplanes polyasparticus TaxID=2856853 RepID=UPI001C8624BD|nr:hypothetical protein [Actinoplanes polyasparticus]